MQAVLSVISEMLEIAILIFQDNSNAKLGKVLIFQAKVCKKPCQNESGMFCNFNLSLFISKYVYTLELSVYQH